MKSTKFKIIPFTYPSGSKGWIVRGSLEGRQIRKKFVSKDEAYAERDALEIKRTNSDGERVRTTTKLSIEQEADATAAIQMLNGVALVTVAEFYKKHFIPTDVKKPLADAVQEYLALRDKDFARGTISDWQIKKIRLGLNGFSAMHPGCAVNDITKDQIEYFLEANHAGLKTQNNRRSILNTFFCFCIDKHRRYISHNPVEDTDFHDLPKNKGKAHILQVDEAAKLMETVESFENGCMVPYFALALFAGIRPDWMHGEITKLKPDMFNWDANLIHIPADTSKVNEARDVTIQPNLRQWLTAYPLETFPIIPSNAKNKIIKIRSQFDLKHDVLRHTAISMHVAKYRSVGDAAIQFGNSESVIRARYLNLIGCTADKAERFWSILPGAKENKVVAFAG